MTGSPLSGDAASLANTGSLVTGRWDRFGVSAREFASDPAAVISCVIVLVVFVGAIFAGQLAPYDPVAQGPDTLVSASRDHLFGTDQFGRDIFSRLLYGARTSLVAAFGSVGLAVIVGTLLGTLSGFLGGWADLLIMRAIDVLLSFPLIILAIMIVVVLGPGLTNIVIAIGVSQVPLFTRLSRSLAAGLRSREFVESSLVMGARSRHVLQHHVLPNLLPAVFVQATTTLGLALLNAAALNFLGLGISPPAADWGKMVAEFASYIFTRPLLPLYPGLAIAVTAVALNLVGDGVLRVVDPAARRQTI